jgi:hypothetical protein
MMLTRRAAARSAWILAGWIAGVFSGFTRSPERIVASLLIISVLLAVGVVVGWLSDREIRKI